MSLFAAVLIIISAVTHAAWNFIGKKEHPTPAFFLAANLVGMVCLVPVIIIYSKQLPLIPLPVWRLLVITGFFMMVYFSSLAGAYRTGDISLAYPLVRSSPIIIVMTVTFILGNGHEVGQGCVTGIILVVAGCFMLPLNRFSEWNIKKYLHVCCLLALLAALGTTGYTIIDDEALRRLRELPGHPFSSLDAAMVFIALEAISTCFWLGFFVLVRRQERTEFRRILTGNRKPVISTGVGIYLTYGMVLWSMAFVNNVSYVAAFRQLSIPLGAFLGMAFLREPKPIPKLVGIGCICIGLVMVGLG